MPVLVRLAVQLLGEVLLGAVVARPSLGCAEWASRARRPPANAVGYSSPTGAVGSVVDATGQSGVPSGGYTSNYLFGR